MDRECERHIVRSRSRCTTFVVRESRYSPRRESDRYCIEPQARQEKGLCLGGECRAFSAPTRGCRACLFECVPRRTRPLAIREVSTSCNSSQQGQEPAGLLPTRHYAAPRHHPPRRACRAMQGRPECDRGRRRAHAATAQRRFVDGCRIRHRHEHVDDRERLRGLCGPSAGGGEEAEAQILQHIGVRSEGRLRLRGVRRLLQAGKGCEPLQGACASACTAPARKRETAGARAATDAHSHSPAPPRSRCSFASAAAAHSAPARACRRRRC